MKLSFSPSMAAIVPSHGREIWLACAKGPWSCLATVKNQKCAKKPINALGAPSWVFSSLRLMLRFDGCTRWHCVREQRWFTLRCKVDASTVTPRVSEDSAESKQLMQIFNLMSIARQGTASKTFFLWKLLNSFNRDQLSLPNLVIEQIVVLFIVCMCLTWQSIQRKKKQLLTPNVLSQSYHWNSSFYHPHIHRLPGWIVSVQCFDSTGSSSPTSALQEDQVWHSRSLLLCLSNDWPWGLTVPGSGIKGNAWEGQERRRVIWPWST